jgi:hypothetical protein
VDFAKSPSINNSFMSNTSHSARSASIVFRFVGILAHVFVFLYCRLAAYRLAQPSIPSCVEFPQSPLFFPPFYVYMPNVDKAHADCMVLSGRNLKLHVSVGRGEADLRYREPSVHLIGGCAHDPYFETCAFSLFIQPNALRINIFYVESLELRSAHIDGKESNNPKSNLRHHRLYFKYRHINIASMHMPLDIHAPLSKTTLL